MSKPTVVVAGRALGRQARPTLSSARDHAAAASGASAEFAVPPGGAARFAPDRVAAPAGDGTRRGPAKPRGLALATFLSALALALAGPAAAATRNGGPSPDPSPSSAGSIGGPAPDPAPQATGAGGIVSQSSPGATSHGSGVPTPSVSVRVPSYTVITAPTSSHPVASTRPARPGTVTGSRAAGTSATGTAKHSARSSKAGSQSSAARALRQLLQPLPHVAGTAGSISTAVVIASAPSHRNGVLLLIGAGVLVLLAAAGGIMLRKLWRLHGEWYGGRPA